MEFHILKKIRDMCKLDSAFFMPSGKADLPSIKEVRLLVKTINDNAKNLLNAAQVPQAGLLNAAGLINEILHTVCRSFCKQENPSTFMEALHYAESILGIKEVNVSLQEFCQEFPPAEVHKGKTSIQMYLNASTDNISNKAHTLEEIILLHIAVENPAFCRFLFLFDDKELTKNPGYALLWESIQVFFKTQPPFGPNHTDLITMLREPAKASPHSLKGQLDYIARYWANIAGNEILRLLSGIDIIAEEEKPAWTLNAAGTFSPPPMQAYSYGSLTKEYERFSPDREWMPRVVLMAKTVLVWLDQLSKKYDRPVSRLDEIPDEELNILAQRGFTGLWLIGIWKRSWASRRIKQINGNTEAAASAYSLYDYDIADELGGWQALDNLRSRLWQRGIRLAADMVPNHTGMDSQWIVEKPDLFIQRKDCPYPTYSFNGENLSLDSRVGVFAEDGYYSKTDCAVVFKRLDMHTGDIRYIYHGNDGTGMPWNDTAQINFLNPQAREEVIQKILHVARNFPIIRFDAAMVLAKKHMRRLWYPEAGHGGDIASRAEYTMSNEEFETAIPNEFWREVVDRVAQEVPDTLLLAEAFWMMEGYFVRTLGMHRVYNSAFMNMLKKEENFKYRKTIKNTLEFDPQILKRFVNFMNNPDEETAAVQFGTGDKYFGICTLMVTMPGLPMFGHGQIEGFCEKYGMEFTQAQRNESENSDLIERHNREIFTLIKKRFVFADVEHFRLYDVWNKAQVNENIFAYTNLCGEEKAAVFYNNAYERAAGWVKTSCPYAVKQSDDEQTAMRSTIKMETEDFATALGLTNSKDFYCIFQEQKTALWYIRSNAELFEQGMFIQLNGFECQVLLNIREVQDGVQAPPRLQSTEENRKYALLCKSLGGKGTESVENALQDLVLKDVYSALNSFATKELFAGIAALCLPGLQPKSAPKNTDFQMLLKKYKAPAIAYFEAARIFFAKENDTAPTVMTQDNEKEEEHAWAAFAARIEKLVNLCRSAQTRVLGDSFIQSVYTGLAEQEFMPQAVSAYLMLYALRDLKNEAHPAETYKAITLRHLERKMDNLLKSYGYNSQSMHENFVRMRELSVLCETIQTGKEAQDAIADFIPLLVQGENAPLVLGVNLFENVLWFSREKALKTVQTGVLLYTLLYAQPKSFALMEKIQKELAEAIEQSDYKVEMLIALLKKIKAQKKSSTQSEKADCKKFGVS